MDNYPLFLRNTKTQNVEVFNIPASGIVQMYICGPTVNGNMHIGHAKNYIYQDILKRILIYGKGCTVITTMNITDISDKIDITTNVKTSEENFFEYFKKLNILFPDLILKVSDNIENIKKNVNYLLDNGYAHRVHEYNIKKQKYEDLIRFDFSQSKYPVFIKGNNKSMDDKNFCLWNETENKPGWHVQCSTLMTLAYPKQYDIQFCGNDLYQHLENSLTIANILSDNPNYCSFIITTNPVVSYDHTKMSKSSKTALYLNNQMVNMYSLRWLILQYKYDDDSIINEKNLINAVKDYNDFISEFKRLEFETYEDFNDYLSIDDKINATLKYLHTFNNYKQAILKNIFNNLKIPTAIRLIRNLIKEVFIHKPNVSLIKMTYSFLFDILDNYFGVIDKNTYYTTTDEMKTLIDLSKNFRTSIREEAMLTEDKNTKESLFRATDTYRRDLYNELNIIIEDS